MLDYTSIVEVIKNFGFPIGVAMWALWRLDKSYGKGDSTNTRLSAIEDSQERMEQTLHRNTEIQTELVTTMKIIQAIIGGGVHK